MTMNNWFRSASVTLPTVKVDDGASTPFKYVDPTVAFSAFSRHWQQVLDIINKSEINEVSS